MFSNKQKLATALQLLQKNSSCLVHCSNGQWLCGKKKQFKGEPLPPKQGKKGTTGQLGLCQTTKH